MGLNPNDPRIGKPWKGRRLEEAASHFKIATEWERRNPLWADGGYRGALVTWVEEFFGWKLEIVEKQEGPIGFQFLPKRWVVERTFG